MSGVEQIPGQMSFDLGVEETTLRPLVEAAAPGWGLPPYSGISTPCPKCGSDVRGSHYHDRIVTSWSCYQDYWARQDERPRDATLDAYPEHLHRICSGCGYGWIEATKDAGSEGAEAEVEG